MRLNNRWMKTGALMAALGVVLGAFMGPRLLTSLPSDNPTSGTLDEFYLAVQFQLIHALGIIAAGLLMMHRPRMMLNVAGRCFLAGVLLFSGSTYLSILTEWTGLEILKLLGGVILTAGWIAFVEGACPGGNAKNDQDSTPETQPAGNDCCSDPPRV